MRFDQFDRTFEDALAEEASHATPALDPVPDGTRDFEIMGAKWIESVGKVVVEFATASSSYQKFSLWLKPSEQKDHDKAMLLLNAIGVPRDTPIDDNLKGRFVALETAQASKNGAPVLEKDGRRRIYINGISRSNLEIEHPQAKAERNPQTAAGRVATAKGEEAGEADDIPF